uniref:Uncharacterized protein n=1 Tax=Timema cristinae TaxID=61476 RepID=A0A7R9CT53_TIMCR|nr:unnamed protein product [Timema cristinae]
MERTSRGKFEGGDAAWEEEKLQSYSTSEVRLIEIQENLCADIKDGINQGWWRRPGVTVECKDKGGNHRSERGYCGDGPSYYSSTPLTDVKSIKNLMCLTVQLALLSFLCTCTGRANHHPYCLDRPTVHCHFLAEENEHLLEEWWFNKQMEEPDLFKFLCINTLKHCCPENHYGMECKTCPGFPDNVCNKNGKCKWEIKTFFSRVLELGKVMEHAYVNQATLGIFVTSVLQITMNHTEININFCVLSAIYLAMEHATKEVLKAKASFGDDILTKSTSAPVLPEWLQKPPQIKDLSSDNAVLKSQISELLASRSPVCLVSVETQCS